MNKRIVALALSLLLLFAASGLAEGAEASTPALIAVYNGTQIPQAEVRLRLVTTEGEKLLDGMVIVVADVPTAYMALRAGADAAGIALDIMDEDKPENMFVNAVADLASENPNFWMYYINGEAAQLGIGTQEVKDGDVLEFIYGDYNLGYVEVP